MSLGLGTRLGPYEILAALGAGGMGEVYRARDTKLNREVALKVLPAGVALDPDRLARFKREAQVLASLNHPNIAAIHGFEDSGDIHALVLELVEGETLADRIARGAVPLEDALPIARQICDALEAAHEHGIIHRDLKPANIKVRPDGSVKVLDFGLARAVEASPASGTSLSPTITSPAMMTGAGVLLGTAAYMAPEQARGKAVDKRADIWAFGCVLYEMLTGKRAFEGDEITDVLAAVVRAEPGWDALPAETPASIRRLLRRCLEKDRNERLPDIAVARLEIKDALATPAETASAVTATSRRGVFASPRFVWSVAAVATVLTIAAAIFTTLYLRAEPPVPPVARFQVSPPKDGSFVVGGVAPAMAISPDGTQLAFAASTNDGKPNLLWVRRIDAVEATPLPGTEGGALNPFWSPDSRSIAFFAGAQLKKIDLSGGPPQIVCATPGGATAGGVSSGAWNREGVIVLYASGTPALYRVSASGGTPTPITTLDESRGETSHTWPHFLPDGRHFIYWADSTKPENKGVFVGLLDSKETRQILTSEFAADFAPPNHLLFRRGSALFAQTLNLETFQPEGEAVRVADPVGSLTQLGRPGFSVSETGVLAFWPFAGTLNGDMEFAIHDRTGKVLASLGTASYRGIDLSPDGMRVASHLHDAGGGDVWLLDLERGTRQRFTFEASQDNSSPIWSPDGSRIAYASLRAGMWGLYRKPSSGVGQEELLFESRAPKAPLGYSHDGTSLLFQNVDPKTNSDLWLLPLGGDKKPVPSVQSAFSESAGQISPDGRWVAYGSNQSGRSEIYVQGLSNQAGRWQVSTGGGLEPRWRHDGKELFFRLAFGRIYAVGVETAGDGLRFGIPKVLFEYPYRPPTHSVPFLTYAVSADGQRFFITRPPAASGGTNTPLAVVVNWTAALKK